MPNPTWPWGERLPDLDIALDSDAGPTGLWANDTSMWVITDWFAGRVQVYGRSDGAEQEDRGFTLADWNGFAVAMWSNGDTLWVADFTGWVLAYRLSDGVREPDRDLDRSILREAGNRNPTGLWSNGHDHVGRRRQGEQGVCLSPVGRRPGRALGSFS